LTEKSSLHLAATWRHHRQAVTVAQKGEVEELPLLMMSLDLLELEEGGDLLVESPY